MGELTEKGQPFVHRRGEQCCHPSTRKMKRLGEIECKQNLRLRTFSDMAATIFIHFRATAADAYEV
jgi:hypothetical protein